MPLKIATIPGDGVGPEVVREALKVLEVAASKENLTYELTETDFGGVRYLKTQSVISDQEVADLRSVDAIFLGAVGHPEVKPGILERGLLLRLRFELDLYINLRPVRLYPGIDSPLRDKGPQQIDMDVVRENTEDLYCGNGGVMRKGTPHEVSTQEMLATRFGSERCLRYAFELARQKKKTGQGRGELTLIHKTNVLTHCGDTWSRAFNEVGQQDYREIQRSYHHVDACCLYMVTRPEIYDTLVAPNMFGDIITDLGAAIAGGLGIAASGNLNPDGTAPSMFEPVHGSAPDIAGQNQANPVAAILSMAMLLTETGRIRQEPAAVRAGERIEAAVRQVCPRFAGQRLDRLNLSTTAVGDMVAEAL